MLDEYLVPQRHVNLEEYHIPDEIPFAPGKGQIPVSVFNDEDAEYLAFPIILCRQCTPNNNDKHLPMHYSNICK